MGNQFNGYPSVRQGVEMMTMWPLDGELYCMSESDYGVLDETRHRKLG